MEVHVIDLSSSTSPKYDNSNSSKIMNGSGQLNKENSSLLIPSSSQLNLPSPSLLSLPPQIGLNLSSPSQLNLPDASKNFLSPDRTLINQRRASNVAAAQGFFYKHMMNKIINSPLQMVRKQEKLLQRYNDCKEEFDDLLNRREQEEDFDRHHYSELLNKIQRSNEVQRQELDKLKSTLHRFQNKDYYMPHDENVYFNEVRHFFLAEKSPDSNELSFAAAVTKLQKKYERMSNKLVREEYTTGTLKHIKKRTEEELDIRKLRRDELNTLNKILQIQYENMSNQMQGIKTDERNLKNEIQMLAEDLFADAQLNQQFADKKKRVIKTCKKDIRQNMLIFNDIDEELKKARETYNKNLTTLDKVEKDIADRINTNIDVNKSFVEYLDRILDIFVRGSPENYDLNRCFDLTVTTQDLTRISLYPAVTRRKNTTKASIPNNFLFKSSYRPKVSINDSPTSPLKIIKASHQMSSSPQLEKSNIIEQKKIMEYKETNPFLKRFASPKRKEIEELQELQYQNKQKVIDRIKQFYSKNYNNMVLFADNVILAYEKLQVFNNSRVTMIGDLTEQKNSQLLKLGELDRTLFQLAHDKRYIRVENNETNIEQQDEGDQLAEFLSIDSSKSDEDKGKKMIARKNTLMDNYNSSQRLLAMRTDFFSFGAFFFVNQCLLRFGSTIVSLTTICDFLKGSELYRVAIRTIKYALINKLNVDNKDERRRLEPLLSDSESSDDEPGVPQLNNTKKKSSFWEISRLLQERIEVESKNEHVIRAHKSREIVLHFEKVFPKEHTFAEYVLPVIFEDLLLMQYTSTDIFTASIDRVKERFKKIKRSVMKRELDQFEKHKIFLNILMEEMSILKDRTHQEFHEGFLELLRKLRELFADIGRTSLELRAFLKDPNNVRGLLEIQSKNMQLLNEIRSPRRSRTFLIIDEDGNSQGQPEMSSSQMKFSPTERFIPTIAVQQINRFRQQMGIIPDENSERDIKVQDENDFVRRQNKELKDLLRKKKRGEKREDIFDHLYKNANQKVSEDAKIWNDITHYNKKFNNTITQIEKERRKKELMKSKISKVKEYIFQKYDRAGVISRGAFYKIDEQKEEFYAFKQKQLQLHFNAQAKQDTSVRVVPIEKTKKKLRGHSDSPNRRASIDEFDENLTEQSTIKKMLFDDLTQTDDSFRKEEDARMNPLSIKKLESAKLIITASNTNKLLREGKSGEWIFAEGAQPPQEIETKTPNIGAFRIKSARNFGLSPRPSQGPNNNQLPKVKSKKMKNSKKNRSQSPVQRVLEFINTEYY